MTAMTQFSPYCGNVAPQQSYGQTLNITAYRGEYGEGVLNTKLGALSFGPHELAMIYALDPNDCDDEVLEPKMICADITIKNCFVNAPDDPFLEAGHIARRIGVEHAVRIAIKYADSIMNTNNWDELSTQLKIDSVKDWLNESLAIENKEDREAELLEKLDCLYFDGYRYFDDPGEIAILTSHGYDGACVGSSGAGAGLIEYRVFSPEQVQVRSVELLEHAQKPAYF